MADPVSLAITVALNVASMALTASRQIEGPRLKDLKASTADYGTPLVQFYGTKRLECICIYAEDIREEKHQQKTKGGKYNEYKYFGTWASFVADHEIDGVLQVWLDRHLVFDRTGNAGPITPVLSGPFGMATGLKAGTSNFRIYLGTEDQSPDPRLLAKIEAAEGPGTCPAYLGISYMVFEDIPLDAFGNRLPQVSARATRQEVPHFPNEVVSKDTSSIRGYGMSAGGQWMVDWSNSQLEWWNLPTRTNLGIHGGGGPFSGFIVNVALAADGTAYYAGWAVSTGVTSLYTTSPLGTTEHTPLDTGSVLVGPTRVFDDSTTGTRSIYIGMIDPGYILGTSEISDSRCGRDFARHANGDIWGLFQPNGSSNQFEIRQLTGGASTSFVLTGLSTRSDVTDAYFCHVPSQSHWYVVMDGDWYTVDDETGVIKDSGSQGWVLDNFNTGTLQVSPGTVTSFWSRFDEVSMETGARIRIVDSGDFGGGHGPPQGYDPVNHAIIADNGSNLNWHFLDKATGSGWTLGDILADVAEQCGMRSTEYDFTALNQNIPGFAWTQGPGQSIVGPLLDIHDSDVRPHGFSQQGLKRGQPLTGDSISYEWMVNETRGDDAASQPLYSIPITSETDLPLRVAATFADPGVEEQPNTAHAQRNAASVKTNREQSFDLTTLAEDADVIQGLLERALRRYWVGSTKPRCRLTPLEIRLEPADVRTLLLEDGERLRCRATRVNIRANRVIDAEWELDGETQVNPPSWDADDASPLNAVYTTPPGVTYGRPDEGLPVLVSTQGFVLDLPLLADADDQTAPFLYDAAAPAVPGGYWPGAAVWSADDNEDDSSFSAGWDTFGADAEATWGYCQTTLPDAETDVVDEGSTLRVRLMGGSALESVTNDAMLADQAVNLALAGDELIQFREAELVDTDTYDLTGLVRGARNSEYAATDHASGEKFLLIDTAVHKRTVGAGEIGDTDYYKFSTTGSDLDTAELHTVDFDANAHRPPAVAHLDLARDTGTGDWTISWIRRTRIGGSSVNGQDVPLGETSESYRVKIMNGATVVNSYDVTANEKVYTAAEQVADWGGAQSTLTVQVCQMSPALSLEGFASTASG